MSLGVDAFGCLTHLFTQPYSTPRLPVNKCMAPEYIYPSLYLKLLVLVLYKFFLRLRIGFDIFIFGSEVVIDSLNEALLAWHSFVIGCIIAMKFS